METDHINAQKKCFFCHNSGHLTRHSKSRSVNAIAKIRKPETGDSCCWKCKEVGHLKKKAAQKQWIPVSATH